MVPVEDRGVRIKTATWAYLTLANLASYAAPWSPPAAACAAAFWPRWPRGLHRGLHRGADGFGKSICIMIEENWSVC